MAIKNIFSTPIATMALENHEHLNAEIISAIEKIRQNDVEGTTRSNLNGWHSKNDFFLRNEPSFKVLTGSILNAAQSFSNQLAQIDWSQYQISGNGWINVSGENAMNVPHTHPGSHISGTYYVQNPQGNSEKSGMIEFLDPRNDVSGSSFKEFSCTKSSIRIKPAPGTLILFPSYLRHWVYPNESKIQRITIAFNLLINSRLA